MEFFKIISRSCIRPPKSWKWDKWWKICFVCRCHWCIPTIKYNKYYFRLFCSSWNISSGCDWTTYKQCSDSWKTSTTFSSSWWSSRYQIKSIDISAIHWGSDHVGVSKSIIVREYLSNFTKITSPILYKHKLFTLLVIFDGGEIFFELVFLQKMAGLKTWPDKICIFTSENPSNWWTQSLEKKHKKTETQGTIVKIDGLQASERLDQREKKKHDRHCH